MDKFMSFVGFMAVGYLVGYFIIGPIIEAFLT